MSKSFQLREKPTNVYIIQNKNLPTFTLFKIKEK